MSSAAVKDKPSSSSSSGPPEAVSFSFSQIKLSTFFDIRKPWVLVPNGSLMGYFDWVPEHLRVGPWSPSAIILLILASMGIVWYRPETYLSNSGDGGGHHVEGLLVSNYPKLYSGLWWYNVLAFVGMMGLYGVILYRVKSIFVAFTLCSWFMNGIRHGIHALASTGLFLTDHHILLQIHQILRFPALSTATITSFIWNFVLFPYIYCMEVPDKDDKKYNFLRWNFNFRLVQLHICNVAYSIGNTLLTEPSSSQINNNNNNNNLLFTYEDLWYGLVYIWLYTLFYTLILDRIGVHLYPIFSPRSKLVIVTYGSVVGLFYGTYRAWNYIIQHNSMHLSLPTVMGINGIVIIFFASIRYFFLPELPTTTKKD